MTWLFVPPECSPSAPAQEDSNSPSGSPGPSPALWAQSSGKPSLRPSSWRGWRTRPWKRLLSGTTWPPSMAARGVEQWISSLRASPASPSAAPANASATPTCDGSGPMSPAWFARWSPASSSWRTSQTSLLGAEVDSSEEFSATWPTSGSMLSGRCYRRGLLVPPSSASASTCWPTATTADSRSGGASSYPTNGTHHAGTTLTDRAVRMWPTPTVHEPVRNLDRIDPDEQRDPLLKEQINLGTVVSLWKSPTAADGLSGPGVHTTRGGASNLRTQVALWPAPQARDARALPSVETAVRRRKARRRNLDDAVSIASSHPDPMTSTSGDGRRVLNPQFDEWLMGWPIGWTESTRSAMASYRWWLRMHSSALRAALGSSTRRNR